MSHTGVSSTDASQMSALNRIVLKYTQMRNDKSIHTKEPGSGVKIHVLDNVLNNRIMFGKIGRMQREEAKMQDECGPLQN